MKRWSTSSPRIPGTAAPSRTVAAHSAICFAIPGASSNRRPSIAAPWSSPSHCWPGFTEFALPAASNGGNGIAYPLGITAGPDGNVWFTDAGTNAIGVATLATSDLAVTQQPPSSITAGSPFGLTVQAEDSSGNLLSAFDGTVTVSLANNPGGATLGGTTFVTASDGVAPGRAARRGRLAPEPGAREAGPAP